MVLTVLSCSPFVQCLWCWLQLIWFLRASFAGAAVGPCLCAHAGHSRSGRWLLRHWLFCFQLVKRDVRTSSCPCHRRCSTWVIVGPRAQLASMFHPARATAAAAYLGSLIFALFAAFFGGRLRYPLVLISLVVEVLACTFLVLLCRCAFCRSCLFTDGFCTRSLPMLGVIPDTVVRTHHLFVPRFSCLCYCCSLCDRVVRSVPLTPLLFLFRCADCTTFAVVWYSLSYIPFGRQALSRLTGISW